MRIPIIAGNWKMNKTPREAVELSSQLKGSLKNVEGVDIVICPTFVCLSAVKEVIKGSNIKLGAQNMHWEEKGAYTGEISPGMLVDIGVEYVIIGHSERRQYFAETDETVNKKVLSALSHDLIPIICVGETLEQREQGLTDQLVASQTRAALDGLVTDAVKGVVIAYEPIWAIGTGKTASTDDAGVVITVIRKTIGSMFGQDIAEQVRIQYGGSVNGENAGQLMAVPQIDGALVGGASLKADEFYKIVNF